MRIHVVNESGDGVRVANVDENSLTEAHILSWKISASGIPCTVYPGRLKRQLKLIQKDGEKYCIIIGPDEIKGNYVTLKDMDCHTEERVPKDMILEKIREWYFGILKYEFDQYIKDKTNV